jgi:tRNA 2-thiouridine synthesizing protein A
MSAAAPGGSGRCYHFFNPKETVMNFDVELDARNLNCPLPILRAKKTLVEMGRGQVLRIRATDPGAVKDFQAFARQTGNELLSSSADGGEYVFFLKKH